MSASFCLALLLGAAGVDPNENVVLVEKGVARTAIVAPRHVLDAKPVKGAPAWNSLDPAVNQLRLRDSVRDLAAILEKMSGAKIEIVADALPPGDKRLPILIGEPAGNALGQPKKKYPYQQGFRLVVGDKGVGLAGESDLATSYAVYTLLDQLGCRWFMPGPLGEVVPAMKTIRVPKQDLSTGPYTVFRGLWYIDQDFGRRNRLGGMQLQAGHALEMTVPKKLRTTNPEIRALVNGKPDNHRVKWTHPLVAKAIADELLSRLAKDSTIESFPLSPDDGIGWDESDDAKFDAGDFDAAVGTVSKTDRLLVLANRVAAAVTAKHPDVKFGLLAYADYIRPPVREKVHPAVVPQVAPITFSRAHPMTADEPNNKGLRYLVEGWGKAAPATSYYFYAFNLAEVSAPNPMITKWSVDIPIISTKGKCRYWQPETLPNFETCLHAHTLGVRLAWDPEQSPKAVVDDLHEKFYPTAAKEMAAYWRFIDHLYVDVPEYAGCGFGYPRRFTKKSLDEARLLMDKAKSAARTQQEKDRIALADESLALFEQFMTMHRDLAGGRFTGLAAAAGKYFARMEEAARKHRPDYCFSYVPWGFGGKGGSLCSIYFRSFFEPAYLDAARIARDFKVITPTLRAWRWRQDRDKKGEAAGWAGATFDDREWKTTDPAVDTWSALGLHNYMGALWYRARVKLPDVPAGKKVYLWIGATDGSVKVFVNGKHVPFAGGKNAKPADAFTGYCQPASFDITPAIKAGAENQISLLCTRTFLNELGTGGLLSAPVVYREKD